MWRGLFRSLLGLTPSPNEVASALLNLPPRAARARVTSMGVAALMAERERARLGTAYNTTTTTTFSPPPAEVRKSMIQGAGCGLFMRRDTAAKPGDFIAIYAGTYTPPVPPVTPGADGTSVIIPEPKPGDEGGGKRNTSSSLLISGSSSL